MVFAINFTSPKNVEAQSFMQENVGTLRVAHQNIFETLRVLTHTKFPSPMKTSKAVVAIENILKACNIIALDYKTHRIALELIRKYNIASIQVFDAYLAATAISNGVTTIATDNIKDLQQFSEIRVINPFS